MPRQKLRRPPGARQDSELKGRLDQLLQLKHAQDLAQKLITLPTISPICHRLVTMSSDRGAVRLLREIRRHVPRAPVRNVGRPKGPTTKLDADGVAVVVLVNMLGWSRAQALRAVGRDTQFAWLRRRLNTWRRCCELVSPEQLGPLRYDMTRAVLTAFFRDPGLSFKPTP